jgi:Zn-dependent M28 family amino/carboxypeptidase
VDSPGVHDNATGTAGLLELARARIRTYHREDDAPEKVDVESVIKLTQVTLAAVLELDRAG